MNIFQRIVLVSRNYLGYLTSGFFALVLAGLISIWPSYAIKLVIDSLASGQKVKEFVTLSLIPKQLISFGLPDLSAQIKVVDLLNWVPLLLLLVYFIDGLLKYVHSFNTRLFGILIANHLRLEAHNKLLSLSLQQVRQRSTGDLISCLTADLTLVQTLLAEVLTTTINDSATAIVFCIWLLVIDWKLSLIGLIIIPLFFLLISRFTKRLRGLANDGQKVAAKISGFISESVQGIDLIHLFNIKKSRVESFEEASNQFIRVWKKQLKIDASVSPFTGLLLAVGIGSVVWVGTHRIFSGSVSVGDFGSYLVATILLYQPLKRLTRVNSQINQIVGTCQRVFELIDTEPEIATQIESPAGSLGSRNWLNEELSIELKDVKFHYNAALPVLKGVNLSIKAGDKIAIVGSSGSGKSTLIRLLPRLYDASQGRILVNKHDIKNWDVSELRSLISFVSQDPFLFSGTLKENLLLVNPKAGEAELQRALKLAKVDFLNLIEGGLDGQIDERGLNLSGGQRQRLSIARAIIKDSPIMILDEPTSSLDQYSEELIKQSITEIMQEKTVILVTHKLNIVKSFPRIVLMAEGQIVEEGNYQSLMKHNGAFAALVNAEQDGLAEEIA